MCNFPWDDEIYAVLFIIFFEELSNAISDKLLFGSVFPSLAVCEHRNLSGDHLLSHFLNVHFFPDLFALHALIVIGLLGLGVSRSSIQLFELKSGHHVILEQIDNRFQPLDALDLVVELQIFQIFE